jgi:hypothetical protein
VVLEADLRYFQHTIHIFDVSLDISNQILSRLDSSHVQCGSQGSSQSARNACDDVVERRRELGALDLSAVLLLVEMLNTTMNAEMDWIWEVFDVGRPVGPLMFLDANATGMDNCHVDPSFLPGPLS